MARLTKFPNLALDMPINWGGGIYHIWNSLGWREWSLENSLALTYLKLLKVILVNFLSFASFVFFYSFLIFSNVVKIWSQIQIILLLFWFHPQLLFPLFLFPFLLFPFLFFPFSFSFFSSPFPLLLLSFLFLSFISPYIPSYFFAPFPDFVCLGKLPLCPTHLLPHYIYGGDSTRKIYWNN